MRKLDAFQQRHVLIAFVYAVQKKYSDDQGGQRAALITYYGFLSLFPLLLASFTVAAYVLAGDVHAIHTLEAHLGSEPILGQAAQDLEGKRLQGSAIALIVGVDRAHPQAGPHQPPLRVVRIDPGLPRPVEPSCQVDGLCHRGQRGSGQPPLASFALQGQLEPGR